MPPYRLESPPGAPRVASYLPLIIRRPAPSSMGFTPLFRCSRPPRCAGRGSLGQHYEGTKAINNAYQVTHSVRPLGARCLAVQSVIRSYSEPSAVPEGERGT